MLSHSMHFALLFLNLPAWPTFTYYLELIFDSVSRFMYNIEEWFEYEKNMKSKQINMTSIPNMFCLNKHGS